MQSVNPDKIEGFIFSGLNETISPHSELKHIVQGVNMHEHVGEAMRHKHEVKTYETGPYSGCYETGPQCSYRTKQEWLRDSQCYEPGLSSGSYR